jgi:hypothetical protein
MMRCGAVAIDVAWKLRFHGYRSEQHAWKAFQRKCRGFTVEQAAANVRVAGELLDEAIRIVEPVDNDALEQYRSNEPNGPDAATRQKMLQRLKEVFPQFEVEVLNIALQNAVIFHIL